MVYSRGVLKHLQYIKSTRDNQGSRIAVALEII